MNCSCPEGMAYKWFGGQSAEQDGVVCESGKYLNQTACAPCTVCPPGHGVQYQCQASTNTVCTQCTDGEYAKLTSTNRFCTRCSNCTALSRQLLSVCTTEEDTVCGSCEQDHFLQIDRDGGTQCVICSQCPTDSSAVRWFECSHLPENQQCAPGYDVPPVATEANPTAHSVTDMRSELVRLTRNRTVYFPVVTAVELVQGQPAFEIIVSVVAIAFTSLTVTVFLCASISVCKKCCRQHCSRV